MLSVNSDHTTSYLRRETLNMKYPQSLNLLDTRPREGQQIMDELETYSNLININSTAPI